jgi:hypothetical protein
MKENEIPERIKKRIELAKLFYPLERKYERRWGKLLNSGFDRIAEELNSLSNNLNFNQKVPEENTILWLDPGDNKAECMFCLIYDITDLDLVASIFDKIKKYMPVFSYGFVHQKKDGEGVFDIFRFSKFSYLEHCDRVKSPKSKKGTK